MNLRIVIFTAGLLSGFYGLCQAPNKAPAPRTPARHSYSNAIPGYFSVDFGFNRGADAPDAFDEAFWGSRTANIYYHYPVRLGKSRFSFVPGIGLSLERFKFSNQYTVSPLISAEGTRELVPVQQAYGYTNITKSMLIANYLEMPIGFRVDTHPDAFSRSFFFVLGARVGVRYESFTKIKYEAQNETKLAKHREKYGLNPFRYGVYTRIGVAGFSLFFVYNLSPFFEEGKGPSNTAMRTFTVGISIGNL